MNINLAFSCINSNCALVGNQYLEVVANALKHICPACGNNLVKKEELAWYKDILDRTDCWNKKAMEFTPSIIAYEYWRLSDLFLNNKIYGALIQLKDVYELAIKFLTPQSLCLRTLWKMYVISYSKRSSNKY